MIPIKQLRSKTGLSQYKYALAVGITYAAVRDSEQGIYNPSLDTLIKLSEYHNISIDDLVKLNDISEIKEG